MEALKKIDLEELKKRQEILDKKFDKKETLRKRTVERVLIAYFTELGELSQELKSEWNYWKNSTKKIEKRRVLEELSDCLHFYLSFFNVFKFWKIGIRDPYEYEKNIIDLEEAICILSKIDYVSANEIFGAMIKISNYVGATEEEFLAVHHEVWLRNMGERTKEEY